MARSFDGVDDTLSCGSDASIDNFTQRTIAVIADLDAPSTVHRIAHKASGHNVSHQAQGLNRAGFTFAWTVTAGQWDTPDNSFVSGRKDIVVTYDNGSTANDPVIYFDGTAQTITESATPAGTAGDDSASNLYIGSFNGASSFLSGKLMGFCYDNTLWDAQMVNRHRWYGVAPGGPSTVKVWLPMWTDDLVNKGTATANATATGTTMASVPRVERCWGGLLDIGR